MVFDQVWECGIGGGELQRAGRWAELGGDGTPTAGEEELVCAFFESDGQGEVTIAIGIAWAGVAVDIDEAVTAGFEHHGAVGWALHNP